MAAVIAYMAMSEYDVIDRLEVNDTAVQEMLIAIAGTSLAGNASTHPVTSFCQTATFPPTRFTISFTQPMWFTVCSGCSAPPSERACKRMPYPSLSFASPRIC